MVESAAATTVYPAAVFGKRRPFKEGLVREYELVAHSADFPPDALRAFEQVARSFRWAPGPGRAGGVLAPCFALWPLDGRRGVLAVRFRDDGRDDQGRPHLLRADAVFLPGTSAGTDLDRLAGLLTPSGWPDEVTLDGDSGPAAFPVPPDADEEVRQALERAMARDGRLPRLLVGHPADHRFEPPAGEALIRVTPPGPGHGETPAQAPRMRVENPGNLLPGLPPTGPAYLPWALAAAGLALATLAGLGWWSAAAERDRLEDLSRASAEAEVASRREAEALRHEAADLKTRYEQKLARLAADLEQRDSLLKQWKDRLDDAERARQVFEQEMQRQGKPHDAAQARVQLERADKERLRLRYALDELTRLLGGFEKGLTDWRRKNPQPLPDAPVP